MNIIARLQRLVILAIKLYTDFTFNRTDLIHIYDELRRAANAFRQ